MSKTLVIVESPAKAKTIGKFLGKKYIVKASMGHVRDLPKSQLAVDVENDFSVRYITIRGKGDLIKELKSAAQKSEHILLATDPDREGEAIAWHLKELLGISEKEKCRVEFNEITQKTITDAVKNPREVNYQLVNAQQTRRVLDRLVGYKLSPLLWRKIKKGLSAGRVQSVVVRLICDRENEINKFIEEEYWSITASHHKDKVKFESKLQKIDNKKAYIKNEAKAKEILLDIGQDQFVVSDISKKKQRKNPAPPFITSTLQQEAYRKYGYAAKKTMIIAQQLYEGIDLSKAQGTVGLITYMRTDSTRISEEAKNSALLYIKDNYGIDYVPEIAKKHNSKVKIQGAHECVRPTDVNLMPDKIKEFLSAEQYKVYRLIWERFLASQMAPAIIDSTSANFIVKKYQFKATGSVTIFQGYTKIYIEGKDEQENETGGSLPDLKAGEAISAKELIPKQHFTQPLPRFTEATLIKTLEENGIGRPSTYAPILDTILSRGYVVKRQKQYSPTELGCVVIDLLKNYFPEIISTEFTARLEKQLDGVETGETEWKEMLNNFYGPFYKELEKAENEIGKIELKEEESDVKCENCGKLMVYKMGRFGKFLACPGFPQCRNTKPILEETGIACPKCSEGRIVIRSSRKGKKFYGCSTYPNCDYVSWDEPAGEKCPRCSNDLYIKRNKAGVKAYCISKDCGFEKKLNEEQNG